MKITIGQINNTPGRFQENTRQIIRGIDKALEDNSDLIVFPELSIPGYLSRDFLYCEGYIEQNLRCLQQIEKYTLDHPDLTVIVGYADRCHKTSGKPFANMAAVIRNGITIARYQKHLLPFYDVFDEPRWYEPGTELCKVEIAGRICGITICEDLWNDKGQDDYNYRRNPVARYREEGCDTIVNLSSSPYYYGKPALRAKMARKCMEDGISALIYVNQHGGQDELVFDGHSFICSNGQINYMVPNIDPAECDKPFFQTLQLGTTIGTKLGDPTSYAPTVDHFMRDHEVDELFNALVMGLRDYIRKTGFHQVVLGSSGGIDSAVVAALACEAIGSDYVHCIMMPSIYSSDHSLTDAQQLHKNLDCHEYKLPIEHLPVLEHIQECIQFPGDQHPVADENIQARLRGMMGPMDASNRYGLLPLTTGNKTELAVGYCTLYGDMNGGYNPIGDCYKDQVYALAAYMNKKAGREIVPTNIITKDASAELAPGQTDEASLMPYPVLNRLVKAYIEDFVCTYDSFLRWLKQEERPAKDQQIVSEWLKGDNAQSYSKMIRRINAMEFKRRQAAPTIKVSRVAFGTGRRMPIVHGADWNQ